MKPELLNIILEYKEKNEFLKKEFFFIGFILLAWTIFMFYLNNWNDAIVYFTIIFSLFILSLKSYDIFNQKSKKFDLIFQQLGKNKKPESWTARYSFFDYGREKEQPKELEEILIKFFEKNYKFEISTEKAPYENDFVKKHDLSTLSEPLVKRSEERRKKMKIFNYQFGKGNEKIDFMIFLENKYFTHSVSADEYSKVFGIYTDYLKNKDPKTLYKILDKINMENTILNAKSSEKKEAEIKEEKADKK